MRYYWPWPCVWWQSAGPQRKSATSRQPFWPQPRWRYEPPQTIHSEARTPPDIWYQCLICLILTLSPTQTHLVGAEAHVAKLQDRREDCPDGRDLISMQTDGLKALNQKLKVLLVLLPLQFTATTLEERNTWATCLISEEEGKMTKNRDED